MEQEGGTHSDPAPNWEAPRPETGLEEPMWQLGLQEQQQQQQYEQQEEEGHEQQLLLYPERPGEPDCIYYLRTGFCGYGDRCRFNHPRDRSTSPVVRSGRGASGGEYPERAGQPICQYYMRMGSCKFGSSCKYHHPRQGASSVSQFALNVYGYPLRPGEKECTYYIKTGQCKFGMTCKFHHPPPSNAVVAAAIPAAVPPAPLAAPSVYSTSASHPYGMVTGNWPVARPSMVPGSYIQGPYGPVLLPPGIVPFPNWAPYPGASTVSTPNTQSVGAGQFYGVMPLSPSGPAYTGPYQAIPSSAGASSSISKEQSYPQRPGQPECQHYIKTGDCKFGSSCKYHHPLEWVVPETSSSLSPMGLPLRPGAPTCSYYAQHGVCKFGPTCKFDHPMGTLSYSPSASSLSDMPVAPYPVGSSAGTLAPSSSSSDLRAEVVSGSNKETASTLSSSVTISSGSGGSVLSKSGSISQSGLQQSSQNPATSSSNKGGAGHGGAPS